MVNVPHPTRNTWLRSPKKWVITTNQKTSDAAHIDKSMILALRRDSSGAEEPKKSGFPPSVYTVGAK